MSLAVLTELDRAGRRVRTRDWPIGRTKGRSEAVPGTGVFVDRLLATLVHPRHGVTHDMLACWFRVPRSTITWAVSEVRPPLAKRGCTVPGGVRLHTGADVIAHPGHQRAARPARCHRGPGAPPGGWSGRPPSVRLRQGPLD
jgi:hypothetical protein